MHDLDGREHDDVHKILDAGVFVVAWQRIGMKLLGKLLGYRIDRKPDCLDVGKAEE